MLYLKSGGNTGEVCDYFDFKFQDFKDLWLFDNFSGDKNTPSVNEIFLNHTRGKN